MCLAGLAAAQEDAVVTGAALDVEVTADVDKGWQRLTSAHTSGRRRRLTFDAPGPRWRAVLRKPVVAAVGVAVVLTGAGAAAAADWLQVFRTEQITPITVTQADLLELPDLSAFGVAEVIEEPNVREVAGAAAAEKATGLSVPQVTELPRGVVGEPTYQVGDQITAVFTFSAEKAERAAEAAGETLPTPPQGLDGSQFRMVAGPGLGMVWSEARGLPAMIVARAVAPSAYSSGIPFETARDYLLSLPGMPDDVASQLRSFSGDGTTLPVPVSGEMETSAADVDGLPATTFTSQDETMAGVVWVDDGIVNAVVGSLSADEVLSVARGLR